MKVVDWQPSNRWLAVVASFALAVASLVLPHSPASAADSPTIVSPVPGASVTALVAVEITSNAGFVEGIIDGVASTSRVESVVGGVATFTLPAYGLGGSRTITVTDCADGTTCGGDSAQVTVTVTDPAPEVTSPPAGASYGQSVPIAASSLAPAVQFLVDGDVVATDTVAPFSDTLDAASLSVGTHMLRVRNCTEGAIVCEGSLSDGRSFTTLRPRISINSLTPSLLSPNGDGIRDTAVVKYNLAQAASVRYRVFDRRGTQLAARSIGSGPQRAGRHAFTLRLASLSLRSGSYKLQLDAKVEGADGAFSGSDSRRFTVDVSRPRFSGESRTYGTVFPTRDGYRDNVRFRARVNEAVTQARLVVKTRAGRTVYSKSLGRSSGAVAATWNGRWPNGSIVPGRYIARFSARDRAGNIGTSDQIRVRVSDKRLTTRTTTLVKWGDQTRAVGSTDRTCADWSHRLSDYSRGLWMLNVCGAVGESDIVAAFYSFTVPRAVRYSSFELSTYGFAIDDGRIFGGIRNRSSDRYRVNNRSVGVNSARWYRLVGASGSEFVTSRRNVSVAVGVAPDYRDGVADFDVGQVALRVTYKVLT